ncbi:MAG: phosphatidate cytidylyltransferase [Deltaproteobacteria bacterium]|jgi:phosphatidate cytidylyltransferase|nr:phosphatidate cytidylyltransferase [Deltaproteobacteria bacterium]
MSSNLIKRVLTALVAGPLIIGLALWDNSIGWKIFIIMAALLAMMEYANIVFDTDEIYVKVLTVNAGGLFSILLLSTIKFFRYSLMLFPWVVILVLSSLVFFPGKIEKAAHNAARALMGIFAVAMLLTFLGLIKIFPQGGKWIIFTLTLVWFNDTLAYFVGKAFGKHKFSPLISPNKTWEGALGGILGSLLAGYLATFYIKGSFLVTMLILAAFAGIMGQLGDLSESMLKRSFKIKDSGNIIPGHGGILDRIDALLFASPVVFCYLWFTHF